MLTQKLPLAKSFQSWSLFPDLQYPDGAIREAADGFVKCYVRCETATVAAAFSLEL